MQEESTPTPAPTTETKDYIPTRAAVSDDWGRAEIIFGRLISIDKAQHSVEFEYKDAENEWQRVGYDLPEGYVPYLGCLGEDHEFTVVDDKLDSYECQH